MLSNYWGQFVYNLIDQTAIYHNYLYTYIFLIVYLSNITHYTDKWNFRVTEYFMSKGSLLKTFEHYRKKTG